MTLILDAGGLIALERNDRPMWRRLKAALEAEDVPITHGGVVGQVWRSGGPRQANLSRALKGIDVRGLDDTLGRAAGELLALTRRSDVIDGALVLLARDGDQIATSDPDDIEPLANAAGLVVDLIEA
jgi:hypothetical protein